MGVVADVVQARIDLAAGDDGRTVTVPVVVDGELVGTVTLRFPEGLGVAERDFESRLRWMVMIAAAMATALAITVALFVARRVGGPVDRLIGAVRRIETGDLSARAKSAGAPGELGELASSFDRMAAALAREDELRRVLVADVAHEIRTPVTILQASLEQMVDGSVEAEPRTLSSLHDEVLRLGRVVADLESLAQAQAARLEMRVHPVDLAGLAREALGRLEPAFGDAELQAERDLAPVTVMGDPARLQQVVTNLLTNALKFTPAGGRVLVSVDRWDGQARLQVEDTGPGIPAEELDHVFDRFWRGAAGRSAGGSGVGLAVVAELVRAHGGRVEVTSSPGHGARFTVLLPRA
jgi:signal transduction histidine kinase